jgi:hypothetical protein
VSENQFCSFQSKADFLYFANMGAAIRGFFLLPPGYQISPPVLRRRYERISATKYGNYHSSIPQLVVAKIPNYHTWCFHNFFHKFLRFPLTCRESRL